MPSAPNTYCMVGKVLKSNFSTHCMLFYGVYVTINVAVIFELYMSILYVLQTFQYVFICQPPRVVRAALCRAGKHPNSLRANRRLKSLCKVYISAAGDVRVTSNITPTARCSWFWTFKLKGHFVISPSINVLKPLTLCSFSWGESTQSHQDSSVENHLPLNWPYFSYTHSLWPAVPFISTSSSVTMPSFHYT